MISKRRVMITGFGTVNGLGTSTMEFWQRLIAGESGVGEITRFDTTHGRTHIGCEVKSQLPESGHPDYVHDLAMSAAREALSMAGDTLPKSKTAVVLGTLQGGIRILQKTLAHQLGEMVLPHIEEYYQIYNLGGIARYLAARFGLGGGSLTSCIACAASGAAISRAADLIRLGYADAALTGGADVLGQEIFAGFNAIRSAAPTQCRPFSADREGLVIGEGAGMLVLEAWDSVQNRGAIPLAEMLGSALAEDAYHITAPEPNGEGAARTMLAALADAGLEPGKIDYVNAHGTGTPQNDKMESRALKTVFKSSANRLPVSSIKAAIGHCMGAAGGIEAVASIMTLRQGILPPTLYFKPGDPDCTLDYVPHTARPAQVRRVLSNSFGFGGNNASLIFGAIDKSGGPLV